MMTIPAWVFNMVIILIGIMIIYVWSISSTKTDLRASTLMDLSEYDEFQGRLNVIVSLLCFLIIFLSFSIEMPPLIIFVYISLVDGLERYTKNILRKKYSN